MKAIRIAAIVAALLIGSAVIASAQGAVQQGGPGRREHALDGIELTDAQKAKLEEIQKKYQPEMQALRDRIPERWRSRRTDEEERRRCATVRARRFARSSRPISRSCSTSTRPS